MNPERAVRQKIDPFLNSSKRAASPSAKTYSPSRGAPPLPANNKAPPPTVAKNTSLSFQVGNRKRKKQTKNVGKKKKKKPLRSAKEKSLRSISSLYHPTRYVFVEKSRNAEKFKSPAADSINLNSIDPDIMTDFLLFQAEGIVAVNFEFDTLLKLAEAANKKVLEEKAAAAQARKDITTKLGRAKFSSIYNLSQMTKVINGNWNTVPIDSADLLSVLKSRDNNREWRLMKAILGDRDAEDISIVCSKVQLISSDGKKSGQTNQEPHADDVKFGNGKRKRLLSIIFFLTPDSRLTKYYPIRLLGPDNVNELEEKVLEKIDSFNLEHWAPIVKQAVSERYAPLLNINTVNEKKQFLSRFVEPSTEHIPCNKKSCLAVMFRPDLIHFGQRNCNERVVIFGYVQIIPNEDDRHIMIENDKKFELRNDYQYYPIALHKIFGNNTFKGVWDLDNDEVNRVEDEKLSSLNK